MSETSQLAPQAMLTLLGTGTSMGVPMIGCRCPVCRSTDPKNNRTRSGAMVTGPAGQFVVDTTPEVRTQLLRADVDAVSAAIFTHGHADHVMGLDDLRICGLRLRQPIAIYSEPPVEEHLRRAFFYGFQPPNPDAHAGSVPQFAPHTLAEPFEPFELCGVRVIPIRLMHGQMPVLGFRLGDVAYCTDVSEIPEASWPLLEGLQTLVLGALRFEPHPTHFNIEQAVAVAERLQPERTFFTHISHQLDHSAMNSQLPDGVELAYDGLEIPIDQPTGPRPSR